MYLFYIGCCIGSPLGLIGLVLAIMVWTDKRKLPDQFVILEEGRVIIGDADEDLSERVEEDMVAPSPFTVERSQAKVEPTEEVIDETWKSWDDG